MKTKTWVTSDFHFNHTNICGPGLSSWSTGYRNFGSLEEMNETILGCLNNQVGENDHLYFLGDFAFGDKQKIPNLLSRIICQNIHLIFGNHDSWLRNAAESRLLPQNVVETRDYIELRQKGKPLVVLCHYPLEVWNESARGSIHLHGHSHGSLKRVLPRRKDVGVDTHDFWPYDLEEILAEMQGVPKAPPQDHHDSSVKGW